MTSDFARNGVVQPQRRARKRRRGRGAHTSPLVRMTSIVMGTHAAVRARRRDQRRRARAQGVGEDEERARGEALGVFD